MILFLGFFFSTQVFAGSSANLRLSGVIHSQSATKIKRSNRVQWLIEHTRNSHNAFLEKIEIEGEDQAGVQGKIKELREEGKFIRHEILLDLIAYDSKSSKPVILKFSAN